MIDILLRDTEKYLGLKAKEGKQGREGSFMLKIPERFEVWVRETPEGILLESTLAPMPEIRDKESLFIYLMKANLFGQGTGGTVIGLDGNEKNLTLSQLLPYEVNYALFRDKLEAFINYLEFWQGEIEKREVEARQL